MSVLGALGTIVPILLSAVGTAVNATQSKKQRESNLQAIRDTNRSNIEQVRLQNAAAVAESDKQRAYESAPAQVSRLRSAGMSKAGALGTINGAGGYTPAPVNAAQLQAPTAEYQPIDFSGVVNAIQGVAQLQEQKRVNDSVINKNKAEESKVRADEDSVRLDNLAKDLQYSKDIDVAERFPQFQTFLHELFDKDSVMDLSTDDIWKRLYDFSEGLPPIQSPDGKPRYSEDNQRQHTLYSVVSRSDSMREYLDTYVERRFNEECNKLNYSTSYEQAKAIKQEVKEFLNSDNMNARAQQAKVDSLINSFYAQYYGTSNPTLSDFRLWLNTTVGSKMSSALFTSAGLLITKRLPMLAP